MLNFKIVLYNHQENDDAIKTIKKSKISNRQKENKKKCVVRKVSTSTNQNNSVILLKNDEGVAFKKLRFDILKNFKKNKNKLFY